MKTPTVLQWVLLAGGLACVAALTAFAGQPVSRLWQPALVAKVDVETFALPAKFSMDPGPIADQLSARLQAQTEQDAALRFLLGDEGQKKVAEVVIPRLLSPIILKRTFENIDSLGAVIESTQYKGLVSGSVTNNGNDVLTDVALTLPGALRAETQDGGALDVVSPSDDVQAVKLNSLDPGQTRNFYAWLDRRLDDLGAVSGLIRIGAADGLDGAVELRGAKDDWFGSAIEVQPWARWLISGLLAAGAALCFVGLAVSLVMRQRPSSLAPRPEPASHAAANRA